MVKKIKREYLLIIAALAGLLLFLTFWKSAFPEAALELNVSRKEAIYRAKEFLRSQGHNLENFSARSLFVSDDYSLRYLERNLGIEATNEYREKDDLMQMWVVRFFKELEKKEFDVGINPTSGRIENFKVIMEEDSPGDNLSQEKAREIGEEFLKSQNIDISIFELSASSSEKLSNRTDHSFDYERKDKKIEEASIRTSVDICGARICNYLRHSLKIPESFLRQNEQEMSHGLILSLLSVAAMIILGIAALIVFITKYKENDVLLKFGLYLAALIGILIILDGINSIPLLLFNYSTGISKSVFLLMAAGLLIIGIPILSVIIMVFGSAGEALSREMLKDKAIILKNLINGRFLSKEFTAASLRGYMLAFIFLGYIAVFYVLGRKYLNIWVMPSPEYSNILGTYAPFLFPLTVSLMASVSEEFIFRLFAIPLAKKYFKYTFLALLIPAFIWGLGHSTYPVFPMYIRTIELTLAGILFGYFFLKYNIETVLIAHYIIDAVLVGMPLLQSSNKYFFISGLIVIGFIALPAIPAVIRFLFSPVEQK